MGRVATSCKCADNAPAAPACKSQRLMARWRLLGELRSVRVGAGGVLAEAVSSFLILCDALRSRRGACSVRAASRDLLLSCGGNAVT